MRKHREPSTAYSNGPWHVELAPNGKPFVTNEQRQHVCTLYQATESSKRNAANAMLIAAAPEMLECLVALYGYLWTPPWEREPTDGERIGKMLDAVITKATGRTEW